MAGLVIQTAATNEPVTIEEAKAHLRVDISDDDEQIAGLITTARTHLEREALSRAFITQTWDLWLDDYPATTFNLPLPPLSSVTHIKYYDEDDTVATYSSANYIVNTYKTPGQVVLKTASSWPSVTLREVNGVNVQFVCGYGAASTVPRPIKQAILLIVGDLYENREDTVIWQGVTIQKLPFGVARLVWPYKWEWGF